MTYWLFIKFGLLGIVGIIAGIVDSIAGGGGLITVPAILVAGLPPLTVLGTNRLQGCVGELTAIIHFAKYRQFKLKKMLPGFGCTVLGALTGTYIAEHLNNAVMGKIIPILLSILLIYIILKKDFENSGKQLLTYRQYIIIFGLVIGFYNGFFGPATGSLWLMGFVLLVNLSFQQATMQSKPFNCLGNIFSAIAFGLAGHIDYSVVFIMALGQIIGAGIGAKLVMTKGSRFIRPLFIVMVSLMTVKLFINYWI